MIYFISGHRDLTQEEFDKYYVPKITRVMDEDPFADFVIGDWEGCDKMALEYILSQESYGYISIYCVGQCRIKPFGYDATNFERTFINFYTSYDDCDATMTQDSDFDIAWIRPGREDSHTAMNIKRRYYGKV